MRYKDLTKYEQGRFNNEDKRCMFCGEIINKWNDDIVLTKYREGLNTIYSKYHETCFYLYIYSDTLVEDTEITIIDRG